MDADEGKQGLRDAVVDGVGLINADLLLTSRRPHPL